MVGLAQLLLRETGIALLLGFAAVFLVGPAQGPVFGAIGFVLSLVAAGVYAMAHALVGRFPFAKGWSARGQQALIALGGLLLGWLLLVPLLGGARGEIRTLVAQLVALYVALRFGSALLWPVVPVRRPVIRDAIVVKAERLLGRAARPYATRPDGSLDEEAVSFVVEPAEAEPCRAALGALLEPDRVAVTLEGAELVIRPAPAPAESA